MKKSERCTISDLELAAELLASDASCMGDESEQSAALRAARWIQKEIARREAKLKEAKGE